MEMEIQLAAVNRSCEIIKAKIQQEAMEAREELATLQAIYEMGEAQIRALVARHRLKLNNQKAKETLARGWKECSAQASELQVFSSRR